MKSIDACWAGGPVPRGGGDGRCELPGLPWTARSWDVEVNKNEKEMKITHIYEKLGVPEMWRRPLASFPAVLWHICHELDSRPFALILKNNCEDCWQDVGRAAEQGLSLPILWDELCSELAAEEVPILIVDLVLIFYVHHQHYEGTGRPTRATSRSNARSASAPSRCATPVFAIFALSTRNW